MTDRNRCGRWYCIVGGITCRTIFIGQDLGQLAGVKAQRGQVDIQIHQLREFQPQERVIPAGVLGDAVVGQS